VGFDIIIAMDEETTWRLVVSGTLLSVWSMESQCSSKATYKRPILQSQGINKRTLKIRPVSGVALFFRSNSVSSKSRLATTQSSVCMAI
jgi:hypothetical protein